MDFDYWANEFAPPWFTRPRRGRGRSRCQCSARLHRNLRDPSEIMNPFAFWTGVWGEAGLRESGSFAGLAPFGLHLLRERVLRVWTSTGRMNSPLNGSLDPGGVADLSPGCLHPGNRSARLRPTPEGSRTFPVPMPRAFAPQSTRPLGSCPVGSAMSFEVPFSELRKRFSARFRTSEKPKSPRIWAHGAQQVHLGFTGCATDLQPMRGLCFGLVGDRVAG